MRLHEKNMTMETIAILGIVLITLGVVVVAYKASLHNRQKGDHHFSLQVRVGKKEGISLTSVPRDWHSSSAWVC